MKKIKNKYFNRLFGSCFFSFVHLLFALLSISVVFSHLPLSVYASNYAINAGTLFEEFETGWSKQSGVTTTVIQNSADYLKTGTGSIKLVSADGSYVFADKTINANMQNAGVISFWVYIPESSLSNISNLTVYFSSVSNWSKYMVTQVNASSLHHGWNALEIKSDSFTTTGSDSWNNTMIKMRVKMNPVTGQAATIYFDNLYIQVQRRPKVLVTFDDGWVSQYSEGYSYMNSKGLKGTVYVIADRVGTTGYVTLSQLQEMYNAGWDLGTHGDVALATLSTESAQEAEVSQNRQLLLDNGFTRAANHYAYPNGSYNNNSLTALSNLGFKTARTIIDRNQTNVIDEPYLITRQGVYSYRTLSQTEQFVDSAITTGTSTWLNFHILTSGPADVSTKWLNSDFEALVDYIKNKSDQNLIDVVTVSEWYEGLSLTGPSSFTPSLNPSGWTKNTSSLVSFLTTSPVGISSFSIKVNSGSYTDSVSSPYTLDTSLLSDGEHTVTIKAIDNGSVQTESSISTLKIDRSSPHGGSITYTNGESNLSSVGLTVSDGTDSSSGVDTSSRIVQRKTGSLNSSCSDWSTDWTTITAGGSYPNLQDNSVSGGHCYQYRYLVSDNAGNQATYSSENIVKILNSVSLNLSSGSQASTNVCSNSHPGSKVPWIYGAIPVDFKSILLYFTPADEPVNKYALEYGIKSGSYIWGAENLGVNSKNQMTFLVKSLSPNTTYYFRIRGANGCQPGNWSNEIFATTKSVFSSMRLGIVNSKLTVSNSKLSKNIKGVQTESKKKTVEKGYSLKVKIMNKNNKSLSGVKVIIHSKVQELTTNSEGIVEFFNVEPGNHRVIVSYQGNNMEQTVNLKGDKKDFTLSMNIHKGNKGVLNTFLSFVVISIMVVGIVLYFRRKK